jgi:hypothetical protein
MALSLGRGRDNNGESGDLQQADTLVLKETGCARDSAEPNEGCNADIARSATSREPDVQ